MPLPRTVEIVEQVAAALHAARAQGIVLCDLHPEAILLGEDPAHQGSTKVVGLGQPDDRLASGAKNGSSRYMAPEEQVAGTVDADERADQFALAAIAYEMLTGCSPFSEEDMDDPGLSPPAVRRPPAPLGDLVVGLPSALDDVFRRAMSFEPAERFPRVEDFAAALRTISEVGGLGHDTRPPGEEGHPTAKVRIRRATGGIGGWMRSLIGGERRTDAEAHPRDRDPPPMVAPAPDFVDPEATPPPMWAPVPVRGSRSARRRRMLVAAVLAVVAGGAAVTVGKLRMSAPRPAAASRAPDPPAATRLPAAVGVATASSPAAKAPAPPEAAPPASPPQVAAASAADSHAPKAKHLRPAHSHSRRSALRGAGSRRVDRAR